MIRALPDEAEVYEALNTVLDPEVPALSVVELGIVRGVRIDETAGGITVDVTPTYSGCPAMREIERDIVAVLQARGWPVAGVRTVYAPPWTTDWMSDLAKAKLKTYGIAPPGRAAEPLVALTRRSEPARCPYCDSLETERRSEFGSTACKAIHFCRACRQPFEEFKAI